MLSIRTRIPTIVLLLTLTTPLQTSAQFTTVINVPPDVAPTSIGSDTQLNLSPGGTLPMGFNVSTRDGSSTNVELNVLGGSVGAYVKAYDGSTVNISGGLVDSRFEAYSGSTINFSGGTIADDFTAFNGCKLNIFGSNFRLDGVLIEGLETPGYSIVFDPSPGIVLSGILNDGTPFAFSAYDDDWIKFSLLTLNATVLPPVGPSIIVLPSDPAPQGIRSGQSLIVNSLGDLGDNFNASWNSNVIISGGQVGNNFEAVGALVSISGGVVGDHFDSLHASTVNISGGLVGEYFTTTGSKINIHGGSIGRYFEAYYDSEVNVFGGSVGDDFVSYNLSAINILGGSIGNDYDCLQGSTVNLSAGSIGNRFNLNGGTANVTGGSIGYSSRSSGGTMNVSGGSIGQNFGAYLTSTINISGGNVGSFFNAHHQTTVNISGGTIGDYFDAYSNTSINLFGTQFLLDGINITSALTTNIPFDITDRDVTLTGLLADGSPFSFNLSSTNSAGTDFFDPNADLTITLVQPGDFNGSLNVDGLDFLAWQRGLNNPIDLTDLADWEANFGNTPSALTPASTTIPEPTTLTLLFFTLAFLYTRHRCIESVYQSIEFTEQ